MKVLFNPHISNLKSGKNATTAVNEQPVNGDNTIELPNFKHVATLTGHINFGAKKISVRNQQLLNEIASLEREKKALMNKNFSEEVEKAREKLSKLYNWNESKVRNEAASMANYYGEQAKEAHIKGHNKVWQFFHGDGSDQYRRRYNSEMQTRFYDKLSEINEIKKNKETYQTIVNLEGEKEEQKQRRIAEIDRLIEANKKLINYQGLQDEINEMLSSKGGISDRIAGYEEEKGEINAKFVQLLAKSKDDPTVEVPAAVLLYGPTGTGKTTFLHGIMDQSKDYAFIEDLSSHKRSSAFFSLLNDALSDADERYINEKKRTIILLNDAEDIFTVSEQEAKILGVNLDGQDRTILESSVGGFELISEFKQLLDTVSKIPDGNSKGGRHATTFFITTNYPHLIHPDLLSREGKMTKIAIDIPRDNNIKEVLKFYCEKMEAVAAKLRALEGNSDYENFINSIAGITDKGKENLKELIKTGKIKHLHVDWQHMPYDILAKVMNPKKEGAYSNDTLRLICQDAFLNYLEKNPEEDEYVTSFYDIYKNTKRDINPERLKKFNLIKRMIKDEKVSIDDIDALLEQKKLGLLSEKQANLLQYHITRIETELESLKEREIAIGLTEKEIKTKEELIATKEKIDNYSNEIEEEDDFEI